jgi:putative ABC transport system substrate-binding protein
MRRRTVLAGLGAVAGMHACPALAQPTPVIGFLNSAAPDGFEPFVAAFRAGLRDAGYIEGQNVAIEYRWAEGRYDRLPALATDLVRRQVSLIAATGGSPAALAAKAATRSLPIVFTTGDDPVEIGIVASLSRPEGNLTGLTVTTSELMPKRLELLRELAPGDGPIALLVNPVYPSTPNIVRDAKAAARTLGRDLRLFEAGNEDEFEPAFAAIAAIAPKGLVVGSDPYFNSRRTRLVALAARHRVAAIYEWREFAAAGGLLSYGARLPQLYREAGAYAGRLLNGAKPGDLPVVQPTVFELVINLETARALGLAVPQTLLVRADEVIE